MSQFVAFTEEQFHDLDDTIGLLKGGYIICCDESEYDVLSNTDVPNIHALLQMPKEMLATDTWLVPNIRLAWMNGMSIELAAPQFRFEFDPAAIKCYAKGPTSTVYGVLGVSDEWTVD